MSDTFAYEFSYYDVLPIPISVVDDAGRLLYYNIAAANAFDRKPEYLGQDIRCCHKQQGSIAKINAILNEAREAANMQGSYTVERKGKKYKIVIKRLEVRGRFVGFVQSAIPFTSEAQG